MKIQDVWVEEIINNKCYVEYWTIITVKYRRKSYELKHLILADYYLTHEELVKVIQKERKEELLAHVDYVRRVSREENKRYKNRQIIPGIKKLWYNLLP